MVLRGEVVETGCFVLGGRRGAEHLQCAIACVRAGQELGILDEKTDTVYLVVQDHTNGRPANPVAEHIAERVEVHGTAIERGGIHGVIVRQVKSLSGAPKRR
jgi:hypothetical protein